MTFKNRYVSAKPLYNYCELPPLETNTKLNQGEFIWKLVHNQQPECMQAIYHTFILQVLLSTGEEIIQNLYFLTTELTLVNSLEDIKGFIFPLHVKTCKSDKYIIGFVVVS